MPLPIKGSSLPLLILLLLGWLALPALAATPLVTLNLPADALVGESFQFTATFDNTGPGTGFGPFVDLVFPAGITFNSATIGINPVTAVSRTFPAGGCVAHPYGVDTFNVPLQVCGTPGDTLVVLQLPFGSFTVNQPPVDVAISATMSAANAHNAAQTIRSRGGFQFGNDELSNPCCDPTVVGPAGTASPTWPGTNITPVIVRPQKTLSPGMDVSETATGQNFVYQYRITVDVAGGQTVNPLTISDTLPTTLVINGTITTMPGGCVVNTTGNPVNIAVDCGSVTGTAAANDVVITIPVSVPRLDSGGNPIIGAAGTFINVPNSATIDGTWTGPGAGAGGGSAFTIGGNNAPLVAARSFATQKGVQVNPDTGAPGPTPGDTLEYTVDFQVSDFFAFANASLQDTISDGQVWDGTAPLLTYTQHGVTTMVPMTPASFSFTTNADGTQTALFNLSGQAGGDLIGGCVPAGGTGGGPADCGVFNGGPTQGRVVYRTIIQDSFAVNFPSGDASVDQGDRLANALQIQGDLLNVVNLNPAGALVTDTAAAENIVQRGTLQKTVYAYNGSTTIPVPLQLNIGDTITCRLRYTIPASDFENLSIADYLPQPIFNAGEVTTFSAIASAAPPAAGGAKYGPADTFHLLPGAMTPTLTVDAAENAVNFRYGTYDNTTNPPSVIDLLFTVTVQNRPFAGNLNQTNVMRSSEGSTNNGTNSQSASAQAEILRPLLITRKGVIGSTGAGTLNPPVAGPVAFTPPGSAGTRFAGTIGSNGLAANDVNSDLDMAAAGETVSFAIVIENVGNQGAFDVVVKDFLPAGFTLPPGGLNLTVTRGDGTPLDYRPVGSGAINVNPEELFNIGLEIVDPGGQPACQTFHPANGTNIIVITYDLTVPATLPGGQTLTNAATLLNFAPAEITAQNQVVDITAYAAWASVGVGMNAVPQYFRLVGGAGLLNTATAAGASAGQIAAFRRTDPLITKRGSPSLARPGDIIEWWIDITSTTLIPMTNIRLSDHLAPYMELLEVNITAGSYSVSGDTVNFTLDVLNPGQTVRITIRTRVRGRLPVPLSPAQPAACLPGGPTTIDNQTCMECDGGRLCTQATVYCFPAQLPNTGEIPWYANGLRAGLILSVALAAIFIGRMMAK